MFLKEKPVTSGNSFLMSRANFSNVLAPHYISRSREQNPINDMRIGGDHISNRSNVNVKTTIAVRVFIDFYLLKAYDLLDFLTKSMEGMIIMATSATGRTIGPQYLWTIAELELNAVAQLGSMDGASYDTYMARMNKIAVENGIANPKLAIGIKFKEGAHAFVTEQPYPITKNEWSVFKKDAETMCEYMPKVFIVDGSKFLLPI